MGSLTVSVGPITGTLTFDNIVGQTVILDYIKVYGGPDESEGNQVLLDWFIRDIARHVQEVHRGHVFRQAEIAARVQADQDTQDLIPEEEPPAEPEP
jgi:hypothetical protein